LSERYSRGTERAARPEWGGPEDRHLRGIGWRTKLAKNALVPAL
jgi:hypothetical protein